MMLCKYNQYYYQEPELYKYCYNNNNGVEVLQKLARLAYFFKPVVVFCTWTLSELPR